MLCIDAGQCVRLLETSLSVNDFLTLAGFAGETVHEISDITNAIRVCSVSDNFTERPAIPLAQGDDRSLRFDDQDSGSGSRSPG